MAFKFCLKGNRCLVKVVWVALCGLLGGCSLMPAETFTLKTDMPAKFRLEVDATYAPAPGETCTVPKGYKPRQRFTGKMGAEAHTTTFDIPLTDITIPGGCPLVLRSLRFDVEGQWGPNAMNYDGTFSGAISVVDREEGRSSKLYNGECQWLFRTMGPYRYIVKILQCRAVDEKGEVLNRLAGGALQRDQLAGTTVNMAFRVANKEMPAVGDNWIQFPAGWKRCFGKNMDDPYAFCNGNTTDFKSFKMPDGRDCTIYPNCIE